MVTSDSRLLFTSEDATKTQLLKCQQISIISIW